MRIKLDPGDVICDKCGGEKLTPVRAIGNIKMLCPRCDGKGKLDWIENIVGKPYTHYDTWFAPVCMIWYTPACLIREGDRS